MPKHQVERLTTWWPDYPGHECHNSENCEVISLRLHLSKFYWDKWWWWWWFSCQVVSNSCDPMDYSPPGTSVHEILQVRILKWVAISFSGGSSQPRNWTWVSCIAGRFSTDWAMKEARDKWYNIKKYDFSPRIIPQIIFWLVLFSWNKFLTIKKYALWSFIKITYILKIETQ